MSTYGFTVTGDLAEDNITRDDGKHEVGISASTRRQALDIAAEAYDVARRTKASAHTITRQINAVTFQVTWKTAPHIAFYVSQDRPGPDSTWSVYSEHYADAAMTADPIDGSQTLVETGFPTQEAADERAAVLYEQAHPVGENLRVEPVMFGNDYLDALDGWQGDAYVVVSGTGEDTTVHSIHLDYADAVTARADTKANH